MGVVKINYYGSNYLAIMTYFHFYNQPNYYIKNYIMCYIKHIVLMYFIIFSIVSEA